MSVYCVSTGSLCSQLSPWLSDPFIQSLSLTHNFICMLTHASLSSLALSLSRSPAFSPFLPGDQFCSSVIGNDFQWMVSTQIHYFLVWIVSCGPAASWAKNLVITQRAMKLNFTFQSIVRIPEFHSSLPFCFPIHYFLNVTLSISEEVKLQELYITETKSLDHRQETGHRKNRGYQEIIILCS